MVVAEKTNNELNELLNRAKKESNKGRYYVYERYKQELISMNLTSSEYEQACRKLAQYLRV